MKAQTEPTASAIETGANTIGAVLYGNPLTELPSWQYLVNSAADSLLCPEWRLAKAEIDELIERVAKIDSRLAFQLDNALGSALTSIQDASVMVGAGLAFTWPRTPDELSDWGERAKRYVTGE